MTFFKITLSTLITELMYGIIHDMITAHLCVEYFTIGHPKIIDSESPVVLAFTWGIVATWWMALPMGLLFASFNHFGKNKSLSYRQVMVLVFKFVLVAFGIAFFAGCLGYFLTESGAIYLLPNIANQIDKTKHSLFLADGWAHVSSYLSGIIGTVVICQLILRKRKKTTSK